MRTIRAACCYLLLVSSGLRESSCAAEVASSGDPVIKAAPGSERPSRIDDIPLYREFYDEPELFRRAHLLLAGIERNTPLTRRWRLNSPEAYTYASMVGPDTGSTDYFPIGSHTFRTVDANNNDGQPVFFWDSKALLIYKKNSTDALKLTVFDDDRITGDDVMMEVTIPVDEFPEPGEGYVNFRRESEVVSAECAEVLNGAKLLFQIKVTEGKERVISESDFRMLTQDVPGEIDYGENVLELNDGDKALLQSWRHVGDQKADGALLWLLGRNDVFIHSHVLQLFMGEQNMDVYVLNWRENGLSRHRGWTTDAFLTSHNKYGDFDVYLQEVRMSLDLMRELGDYNMTIGYGFSTGATILLNYLLQNGDGDFDSFMFNSPFLDWGHVGGDLQEFALEFLPSFLTNINFWTNEEVIQSESTPDAFKDNPINYLGREVVPSVPRGRVFSQHYSDWSVRIHYVTALTAGFARGSTTLVRKIQDAGPITSKPTLVLASLSDKVLVKEEIEEISKSIFSNLQYFELKYNSHDVFLSGDKEDTMKAIEITRDWAQQGYRLSEAR